MIFISFLEVFLLSTSVGLMPILERYVPELRALNAVRRLRSLIAHLVAFRALTLVLFCLFVVIISKFITAHIIDVPNAAAAFRIFSITMFLEGMVRFIDSINDALFLQRLSQIAALTRNSLRVLGVLLLQCFSQEVITLSTWVKVEACCAAIGFLITVMIFIFATNAMTSEEPGSKSGGLEFRRYARYAFPAFAAQIIWLSANIDSAKIVAANIFDLHVSASFGFVVSLVWMIQRYLPTVLLGGLIRPLFVDACTRADFSGRMAFLCRMLIRLNLFVSLPMIFFALMLGDEILLLVSGGRFQQEGLLFAVLLGYVLTQTVRNAYGMAVAGLEDGVASVVAGVISLMAFGSGIWFASISNFLLIPLSLVLGDILAIPFLRYRLIMRGVDIGFPWVSALKVLVASCAAVLVTHCSGIGGAKEWRTYMLEGLIFTAIYLVAAYLFKVFSGRERDAINRVLPVKIFLW